MITQYSTELARRLDLSTALALHDDLDYDLGSDVAPRAGQAPRAARAQVAAVAYFSDWDLDLPSARCHCEHDLPPKSS